MIPYVEIIGKAVNNTTQKHEPFAIVEPSQCWFELSYYEMGEFEIYALATANNLNALKNGNYVKIPNLPYIWIIKSVDYCFNSEGARMIDVKGFEAKWVLNQRIIKDPVMISEELQQAFYDLINNNVVNPSQLWRKIAGFNVAMPSYEILISETLATRGNLYEFLRDLLKTNSCGMYATYDDGIITFRSILGANKPGVIFSQSMDNLISSDYFENSENYKNFIRVVSTFSEKNNQNQNVDVDYVKDYPSVYPVGINLYETLIQSNLSTKYIDANGQEQETNPSTSLYQSWQVQEGKNKLSEHFIIKQFTGEIDLQNSHYKFGSDFFIGDLLIIRDEYFGYEGLTRVLKYTFKQDEKGYGEEAEYGNE